MRMIKCGWKNADDKMRTEKCVQQNKNENIGTRVDNFAVFCYILSGAKLGLEFIDGTLFYPGLYGKSEIEKKKRHTGRL